MDSQQVKIIFVRGDCVIYENGRSSGANKECSKENLEKKNKKEANGETEKNNDEKQKYEDLTLEKTNKHVDHDGQKLVNGEKKTAQKCEADSYTKARNLTKLVTDSEKNEGTSYDGENGKNVSKTPHPPKTMMNTEPSSIVLLRNPAQLCWLITIVTVLSMSSTLVEMWKTINSAMTPVGAALGQIYRKEVKTPEILARLLPIPSIYKQQDLPEYFCFLMQKLYAEGSVQQHIEKTKHTSCLKCGQRELIKKKRLSHLLTHVRQEEKFEMKIQQIENSATLREEACKKCGLLGVQLVSNYVVSGDDLFIEIIQAFPFSSTLNYQMPVFFFGYHWILMSFSEYTSSDGNRTGHYCSWIRKEYKWLKIDDDKISDEKDFICLEGKKINLLYFKKVVIPDHIERPSDNTSFNISSIENESLILQNRAKNLINVSSRKRSQKDRLIVDDKSASADYSSRTNSSIEIVRKKRNISKIEDAPNNESHNEHRQYNKKITIVNTVGQRPNCHWISQKWSDAKFRFTAGGVKPVTRPFFVEAHRWTTIVELTKEEWIMIEKSVNITDWQSKFSIENLKKGAPFIWPYALTPMDLMRLIVTATYSCLNGRQSVDCPTKMLEDINFQTYFSCEETCRRLNSHLNKEGKKVLRELNDRLRNKGL